MPTAQESAPNATLALSDRALGQGPLESRHLVERPSCVWLGSTEPVGVEVLAVVGDGLLLGQPTPRCSAGGSDIECDERQAAELGERTDDKTRSCEHRPSLSLRLLERSRLQRYRDIISVSRPRHRQR